MSARSPFRLHAAVLGVAAFFVAGCSDDPPAPPVPPGEVPTLERTATESAPAAAGYDECGLVSPDKIAEALGVDAMYATARTAMALDDGSVSAACRYFPDDVPGMLGMELVTVTDTDEERFFAPFEKNFDNIQPIKLGDRTDVVAYAADGTSLHFVEIRTLVGDNGLHLFYSYRDGGGDMPKADGEAAAKIMFAAVEELPETVTIEDGEPEGACADIDLGVLADAVGAEPAMARSMVSDDGAMNCYFSGGGATVDITVLTDSARVATEAVAAGDITHADIGEGAKLAIGDAGSLNARVNLDGKVVSITAAYADEYAGEPRPSDVALVADVVDAANG
jgi:hypothetical protein